MANSDFGGGWNHRVIRHPSGDPDNPEYFEVHEVYYNTAKQPIAYTIGGSSPIGETLDILVDDITRFAKACTQPILSESDFPADSPTSVQGT